ncbi:MAG TPA: hypothetical protein VEJ18_08475, partial [Planctomycetota bacterium]|nr:hypothetical protein [Planctomycetota bacterium]
MAIVLAVVLMSARADDEALLKQAEAWTDEQLLGRFYVEQARAGINIVKDLLRGGTPPAPQL